MESVGRDGRDDRTRAERVRTELLSLWGDALPPTADPVLSVLSDAVAVDDLHGIDAGLVVQGDRLDLSTLAALVGDDTARVALLPEALRRRLAGGG